MIRCSQCAGVFVYGEPPLFCNENGVDIPYCRECMEWYASCIWPDDWGPYQGTIHWPKRPPHCKLPPPARTYAVFRPIM
jgi:hypothetical protein